MPPKKTYDGDILDMARHWYGYGRWEAKYWFIGPEPGQPEGDNLNGDNLKNDAKRGLTSVGVSLSIAKITISASDGHGGTRKNLRAADLERVNTPVAGY